jgi:hypothetical protein
MFDAIRESTPQVVLDVAEQASRLNLNVDETVTLLYQRASPA